MKQPLGKLVTTLALLFQLDVQAVEFEKLGSAVAEALGTKKAFQKVIQVQGKAATVFYAKGPAGEPTKLAVVHKAIYEPSCSHTWVVGLDAKTNKVENIHVVEMSCPHAFPAQKAAFLSQYKGKGPADVKKMKSDIQTIAKATGTCNLTTDAVVTAVTAATQFRSVASN